MIFKLKKHSKETDEELLLRYKETTDQEPLGELYARYIPLVYGLCLKYLKRQHEAEDAVMQLYETLVDKCLKHDIANFKSWLYTVAKNHCLQILRKNNPTFFEEISDKLVEVEPFMHLIVETNDMEKEKAMEMCLEGLPKAQLRCIKSFFFEACSYADIVLMTGYSLQKVKSYIQNGKRNLKTCMIKALHL